MRVLVYGMVGTNRGGIETFLMSMNRYMSDDMIFDYVVEGNICIHTDEINSSGGKVYFIPPRKSKPIENIAANCRLLGQLRDDVGAVYFNLSSLSWTPPIHAALRYGYPVYVHAHNSRYINANSSFLYRVVNAVNKKWLSNTNVTRMTCSEPATEFLFGSPASVAMINNAIDVDKYRFDESTRKRIRAELRAEGRKVLGFVGRLSDEKNPLFFPEILNAVLQLGYDAMGLIVGDGSMREDMRERISGYGLTDKCTMLGNRTDVNKLMMAMDAIVLPSLHEGLPYVIIEAQASGLKCFVSDAVTTEADITANVVHLPLAESARAWAEAIIKQPISSDRDRKEIANEVALTGFNIKHEAIHLENVLRGKAE